MSVCAADRGAEDASSLNGAARGMSGGGVVAGLGERKHLECSGEEGCEEGGEEEVVRRQCGQWGGVLVGEMVRWDSDACDWIGAGEEL